MTRALMLTLVILVGNSFAAASEFFVSPTGHDANPGSE